MDPYVKEAVSGTLCCAVATLGVYAVWIEPYLRKHLVKSAPFLLMVFAPMVDYRKVRRIARQRGHGPWFLRVYELLMVLTFVGAIATLLLLAFGRHLENSRSLGQRHSTEMPTTGLDERTSAA